MRKETIETLKVIISAHFYAAIITHNVKHSHNVIIILVIMWENFGRSVQCAGVLDLDSKYKVEWLSTIVCLSVVAVRSMAIAIVKQSRE